jgi:hypothetical protein
MRKTALTDEQHVAVQKRLLAAARENRVMCPAALAIAASLNVPAREVGRIADELNIKISKCQLGCF